MSVEGPSRQRVLIADDHPVVRLGVRAIMGAAPEFEVVGEASDGDVALEMVRDLRPTLLLLDLQMPKLPGLETLRALTDQEPALKTLLLTGSITQKQVLEALQLGARGIVLKESVADHLVDAMRTVVDGRYWLDGRPVSNLVTAIRDLVAAANTARNTFGLTPRELEVVSAIVEGSTNRDIAQRFDISEDTVKRHLTNIFDKTGVSTRLELAMFAVHHQLVAWQ
jgi:two-component system nitrate/nitrite response regulator NarL